MSFTWPRSGCFHAHRQNNKGMFMTATRQFQIPIFNIVRQRVREMRTFEVFRSPRSHTRLSIHPASRARSLAPFDVICPNMVEEFTLEATEEGRTRELKDISPQEQQQHMCEVWDDHIFAVQECYWHYLSSVATWTLALFGSMTLTMTNFTLIYCVDSLAHIALSYSALLWSHTNFVFFALSNKVL